MNSFTARYIYGLMNYENDFQISAVENAEVTRYQRANEHF